MYHHRYQPQTSHLAHRNNNAFGSHNHHHHQHQHHSANATSVAPQRLNNNLAAEVGPTKTSFNSQTASSARYQNTNNFGNYHKPAPNSAYNSGAYSSQPRQFAEERQDVIFRRVRGILNKITPETFDKLSKELINVGLDSPRTLRGLIYLLFDKALKDLKYSSLYAKLCQQLSEKAPNFETDPGPNTFCKFLISKCEDEFERRRRATEDFDGKHELTDEEFEQKVIAKQKMLGNIKFICELGKKRLLQEEILHECIRGLLSKKKERPIQDQAQDLECLCQIMRTIGSLLDIEASRNLMNQYFERIDMYSRKSELPSRIRFMLKDVIDLRNNKWRPRPFQREDNVPQPLSRLREEAGFGNSSATATIDKICNTKNLMNIGDLSKMHGNRLSSLLLEDDGPSFTTTTDFHWGPNTFMPNESEFDIFSSAVPVQKIDTTKTVSSAPSKTNSTNTAPVSKHPFTSNQFIGHPNASSQNRMIGSINNNNGLSKVHDNSDLHTDSSKTNKFSHGDRQPFFKDNITGPHGNQGINRSTPIHGFDGRNQFQEPHLPPMRSKPQLSRPNDLEPISARQDGDRPSRDHNLNNNVLQNNGISNARSSANRDELAASRDSRMMPDAHPRSAPSARDEYMSHKKVQSQPAAFTRPVANNNREQQNHIQGNRAIPDVPENRVEPPRFANGGGAPGPRDRRTDRFEREHRQPKFSGANYRLPGKDRPLRSQNTDQFLASRGDQPESEVNLNWRSMEPASTTQPSVEPNKGGGAHMPNEKQNSANVNALGRSARVDPVPQKGPSAGIGGQVNMRSGTNQKSTVNDEPAQKHPNESDRFKRPQQAINSKDHESQRNDQRSPPATENMVQHKFSNSNQTTRLNDFKSSEQMDRSQDDSRPMQSNRFQRRFNPNQEAGFHTRDFAHQNSRNNGPPPRLNQHVNELSDRRDCDDQRHSSGEANRSEERKPMQAKAREEQERGHQRHAFGRNQSFEVHRPQVDLDKARDWRKDATLPPVKKDPVSTAPSVVPGHLLPKPPTRMSETDFSLRPSHNLIGRTYTEPSPSAIEKPDTSRSVSNINSDARIEARVSIDNSSTIMKQGSDEKQNDSSKPEEEMSKDATKDLFVSKFMALIKQMATGSTLETSKVGPKVKELRIPKSFQHECLLSVMKQSIIGMDIDRENTSKLLVALVPNIFETGSLLTAFRIIFEQMQALEAETPKVKSLVAEFVSRAVVDGLLALEEVAIILSGGKHHPLFLLLLQKLEKSGGQAWLSEKFVASKINLMDMLPEVDRTKDRLASALKDRCLAFLDPILTIEPDLWQQMKNVDPSPAAVYRWIKENVDQTIQGSPTFAHVFITCLLRHIHGTTTDKFKGATNQSDSDDSNKSSPSNRTSQAVNEFEKELLTKYQQVLQALLKDRPMQLATLYAVQAFYHGLDFPKGALLKWFHMLYDLSVVDDDVFFIWKEEINNEFPGKGQALFQVNTWLNWLAEAESEEEEEA